jgi:hypothetical protein
LVLEIKADSINAITIATFIFRSVGKDVSEVSVAFSAAYLGATHTMGVVVVEGDGVFRYRISKRRPAGATIELLVGREQGSAANGAVEYTVVIQVEVFA